MLNGQEAASDLVTSLLQSRDLATASCNDLFLTNLARNAHQELTKELLSRCKGEPWRDRSEFCNIFPKHCLIPPSWGKMSHTHLAQGKRTQTKDTWMKGNNGNGIPALFIDSPSKKKKLCSISILNALCFILSPPSVNLGSCQSCSAASCPTAGSTKVGLTSNIILAALNVEGPLNDERTTIFQNLLNCAFERLHRLLVPVSKALQNRVSVL